MYRILTLLAIAVLVASCATPPSQISNACAIFDQRDGFFTNWHRSAKQAEARYGVAMPIIMATIYTESGFRANAKPPRTKLLGFIPWKRASSAYGYSQALTGTWEDYKKATGNWSANRRNFADAADFIAWYHRRSITRNNIDPNNAYALYLNYYLGHTAYRRQNGQASNAQRQAAQRMEQMARRYDSQLRRCGRR